MKKQKHISCGRKPHTRQNQAHQSAGMRPRPSPTTLLQRAQHAPDTLSAHDVLRLQRVHGNQVVQRLLAKQVQPRHTTGTNQIQRIFYKDSTIHATADYWNTKIAWNNESKEAYTRKPKDTDPSFKDLFDGENATKIKAYIKKAIGSDVTTAASYAKNDTGASSAIRAAGFLKSSDYVGDTPGYQATARKLAAALAAHGQMIQPTYSGQRFYDAGSVDDAIEFILKPKDMIPEEADLPGKDESISYRKGKHDSVWGLVCSLIALVKMEGLDAVKRKVSDDEISDEIEAVQALHGHYKGKGVEYDDTSTHPALYSEWGYSLIFSGKVNFNVLHKHLRLKKDQTFIFDIEGHTVKVKVKKDLPVYDSNTMPTITPSEYFETFSDEDNYKEDEFSKAVEYIYKK